MLPLQGEHEEAVADFGSLSPMFSSSRLPMLAFWGKHATRPVVKV